MNKLELEMEINESYWQIVHSLWREFNEEFGYTPLMLLLKTREFKEMWLETVEVN